MSSDILQALIEERPHLRDPFVLYGRWQRFQRAVAEIMAEKKANPGAANAKAYPRKLVRPVLKAFAAAFALHEEDLSPLGQALEAGGIEFTRLPRAGTQELSPSAAEAKQAVLLFLFSRPWFLKRAEIRALDGPRWEDGRCPVCAAHPVLASITAGPQRRLHCSFCGTAGPFRFIGCPNCGNEDSDQLNILVPEGEAGFRVATCDACRSYLKIVENSVLKAMTPDLADLASLPLDIVAQEKGYARRAPNPIGLRWFLK